MHRPSTPTRFGSTPMTPNVYNDYGVVLVQLGDSNGTATNFAKSIELDPKNVDGQYNLGLILLDQWQSPQAEASTCERRLS